MVQLLTHSNLFERLHCLGSLRTMNHRPSSVVICKAPLLTTRIEIRMASFGWLDIPNHRDNFSFIHLFALMCACPGVHAWFMCVCSYDHCVEEFKALPFELRSIVHYRLLFMASVIKICKEIDGS